IASTILTGTVIRNAPDACTVAGPTEIAAVFHAPFTRGAAQAEDKISSCEWVHEDASLGIHTGLTDHDAFEDLMQLLPGAKTPVPGLGDRAYLLPAFGALFVLRGDTRVSIIYSGPARPDLAADERALAERIVPKL